MISYVFLKFIIVMFLFLFFFFLCLMLLLVSFLETNSNIRGEIMNLLQCKTPTFVGVIFSLLVRV